MTTPRHQSKKTRRTVSPEGAALSEPSTNGGGPPPSRKSRALEANTERPTVSVFQRHQRDVANEVDEQAYLIAFPDVAQAVKDRTFSSALEHFRSVGRDEIYLGIRHFMPPAEVANPGRVLTMLVPLIGTVQVVKICPWAFLSDIDRSFIDAFLNVLFERVYKGVFSDISEAVERGAFASGFEHWTLVGRAEIAGGQRGVEGVDEFALIHCSDCGTTIDAPNFEAVIKAVGDWSILLKACSKGEAYVPIARARAPLGVLSPSSGALSRQLSAVRLPPVDLGVRQTLAGGAEHVYGVDPKLVAFYLPQYHRVKENDDWWGEGFTEWTNVRKAIPNFEGHHQPHVPLNEQYYDLTDPTIQRKQSALAKEYGISAFCYYFYWFDGRRILERPLDQMLSDTSIDHEFCVCWANENWTRTWDGKADDVLIGQTHTPDSDRRFIRDALRYLRDPRYFRIEGKLVLLVYRVDLLTDCRATAEIWREEVRKAGLGDLHLCAIQFYGVSDPEPWGFDAAVEFPPHGWLGQENLLNPRPALTNPKFEGHVFDYQKAIDWALSKPIPDYRWYRGVFPGWDNTARRQDTPHIFAHSEPLKFEAWLTEIIRQTVIRSPIEHQVVFVNAWNEWGEGAHLEPDEQLGLLNLMALNSAINTATREAWPLRILGRLRQPGLYVGRDADERALLNFLRGHDKALSVLAGLLRASGVNPFV